MVNKNTRRKSTVTVEQPKTQETNTRSTDNSTANSRNTSTRRASTVTVTGKDPMAPQYNRMSNADLEQFRNNNAALIDQASTAYKNQAEINRENLRNGFANSQPYSVGAQQTQLTRYTPDYMDRAVQQVTQELKRYTPAAASTLPGSDREDIANQYLNAVKDLRNGSQNAQEEYQKALYNAISRYGDVSNVLQKDKMSPNDYYSALYNPYTRSDWESGSKYLGSDVSRIGSIYEAVNDRDKPVNLAPIVAGGINTNYDGFSGFDIDALKNMSDEQRRIYNYIYSTQGNDQAKAYLRDILPTLTPLQRAEITGEMERFGEEQPVLASVGSVLMSPLRGISYVGQAVDYLGDGKIDQNAGYNAFSYMPTAIRSAVAKDMSGVGSFLYQTGMSMGDFLLNSAITGNFSGLTGNAAKVAEWASLGLMGAGAAADKVIESKDTGMSDGAAFALGTIAGAAEIVTERVSLETLLNPERLVDGTAKYILKNALAEGSEEVGSDLINWAADALVTMFANEEPTKLRQEIAAVKAGERSAWDVVLEYAKEAGLDFLGGALSGGVMAGSGAVIDNQRQTKIGENIRGNTPAADIELNEMLKLAQDPKLEGSLFQRTYNQVVSDPNNTKSISNRNIGKLYDAMNYTAAEKSFAAYAISEAANKLNRGETLTNQDIDAIANNEEAVNFLKRNVDLTGIDMTRRNGLASAVERYNDTVKANTALVREMANMAPNMSSEGKEAIVAHYDGISNPEAYVNATAERLGVGDEGQNTFAEMYNGDQDVVEYTGQMTKYYNRGKANEAFTMEPVEGETITPQQKMAAWNAGRMEYLREEANGRKESIRVREGLPGNDSQSAGRQIEGMETASGSAEFREEIAGFKGGRKVSGVYSQPVSAADLGIRGGSTRKNIRILTESSNAKVQAAKAAVEARGYKCVLFVDGALEINGEQVRGCYDPDTGTIYVRADHRVFTADQIARHEVMHDRIRKKEVDLAAVRDDMIKRLGGVENFDRTMLNYYALYEGTGLPYEQIFEEAVCDAAGDMNEFMYHGHWNDATEAVAYYKAAKEASRATTNGKEVVASDGPSIGLPGRMSMEIAETSEAKAATREESLNLDATDARNIARYKKEIASVLNGTMPSGDLVLIGRPSEILREYLKSDNPLYIPQKAVKKGVLSKENGGKHALGRTVVESLPYQFADPLAITGNTSVHEQAGDNSIVVWTDWMTKEGDSVIVPIVIDINGQVGVYNGVNTVFDAYNQEYVKDLLRDGNVLYTKDGKSIQELLPARRQVPEVQSVNASVDNVPKSEPSVKPNLTKDHNTRFSMDRPIERTNRLIALHNMNEDAVRGMLEIGGLAMPSVAITRADMGHNTYGPISAVYGRDSIDPKNRKNRIYGGDAWTPTFPDIGIKINEKASDIIREKVKALLGDVKGLDLLLDSDNLSDQIERRGSFYNAYKDRDAYKIAFLRDTGRTLTVPMKAADYTVEAEAIRRIARHFSKEKMEEFRENSHSMMQVEPEIRKIIRDYYNESGIMLNNGRDENGQWKKAPYGDVLYGKEIGFGKLDNIMRDVRDYQRNGVRKVIDTKRLEKRLDIAMKTKKIQAEYEAWMNELGKDLIEKRGIRNNTDFFTPYGNRRSFEQLYYPYTLANIVRAMEGQAKQGKTSMLTGSGNIKGAAQQQYSSIEEARRNIDRLQPLDINEENNAAIKAFNDHTLDLCMRMVEGKGHNSFGGAFDAAEVLTEVIPRYQTADLIYRYLKREGYDDYYNVTPEIAKEIEGVIQEARKLPTAYFEGKMYRAVPINEALAYVVPDNMDKNLKQQLIDAGANVVTYKHGNDEDRLAKVNSVEGAKFSRDLDSYLQEQYPEYKTDKENLRLAEEGIRQLKEGSDRISASESVSVSQGNGKARNTDGRRGGSDIQTIGRGITERFIRKGQVNLNGNTVKNAEDVARLCQIFRNPQFETVRYIYVRKGKIVGMDAISSRLPGLSVALGVDFNQHDLVNKLRRVKADGFYMLHNHPSGNVTPSGADIATTRRTALGIEGLLGVKMLGHVVIDHEVYSTIDSSGNVEKHELLGQQSFDLLSIPEIDNKNLGQSIRESDDVARIARDVRDENMSVIIYANAQGKVVQIQEISDKTMKNNAEIINYIRNQIRNNGGQMTFLYTKDQDVFSKMFSAYADGVFVDIIRDNDSGYATSRGYAPPKRDMYLGYKEDAIPQYVNEDSARLSRNLDVSIDDGRASYTDDRINYLLDEYGSKSSPNYSKAYVARINPEDFLRLTSSAPENWLNAMREGDKELQLNEESLRGNRQTPFLMIDYETGEVTGHEGRHRMVAMLGAGVNDAPVVIVSTSNKYSKKVERNYTLSGQDFGRGKIDHTVTLREMQPLSYANRDAVVNMVGGESQVRFSRDIGSTELFEQNRQLKKDLSEMRRQLEQRTQSRDYWRGQTRTTEGRQLRLDDVTKLARSITKGQDSTADIASVAAKMKALGEYLLNSKEDMDVVYDSARLKAYDIAHEILRDAKVLNERGGEGFYQDFLDVLKAGKVYVPQSVVKELAPDGWNEWRRQWAKTVTFTADPSKGRKIDDLYNDMRGQDKFSWLLPEAGNEADELRQILEIVETYRPVYENINSYDMADAVEWAANEILGRIIGDEIRETQPTYADRMEKKLADQKAKTQAALKKVRQRRDERLADLRQHYQEVAADRRAKRADSDARTKLLHIAQRLNNKKLPRVTRQLLEQYIGDLDLVAKSITGKTVRDLEGLKERYEAYKKKQGADFTPDKFIEDKLDRLSKRHISDMTQEEVADLTIVLQNLENMIRTEQQLIDSQVKAETYAAGEQVIEDIRNSNGKTGFLNKYISTETATPEREIHRITGYNDESPLYKLAQELSAGQRNMLDYQRRAEKLFKKWTTDKKFVESIAGKKAKTIKVTGIVGGKTQQVEITPAMQMSLYLHEKNDDNMIHITNGGVKIPNMELYKKGKIQEAYDKGERVVFTRGMLQEIAKGMTAQEKAFADATYAYYNGMSRDAINGVSEKLKGYSIAGVENYYPIDTDGSFLRKEFDSIKRDGSIEGMGMLKERIQGASNPIMLYDMNDTLSRSISQHSKYYGLAIPVRNFNKLYNVSSMNYETSVAETLKKNWGSAATKYIEKMMADLQNGTGLKRDVWGEMLSKARSRYAGAVLTTNASVAIKQAASYPTAAAVVGWAPLRKAMTDWRKTDLEKFAEYTPLLWYRSKGFSTAELGDIGKEGGHIPKALNWIQAIDVATTKKLVKAAMYYVDANTSGLAHGTDAWYKEVAKVYNRIIEETQPNYTMMQRPQILRSDSDLTRALNMFKTQPFQNFNILYDAFGNLAAKSRQYKAAGTQEALTALNEAKKNAVRAVTSQFVSAFVFALMQFAWDAFRGKLKKYKDDDDEWALASWLKGMGINVLSSVGGMIPFGGYVLELGETMTDAVSKAFGGPAVFDQTFYGLSENASDSFNDMGKALINMVTKTAQTLQSGKISESTLRSYVDSAADVAQFAGVPASNWIKLMQSIARNYFLVTDGKYVGGYKALRVTTDPAKYKSDYYALLQKAYQNDKTAYATIYDEMIKVKAFETESNSAKSNIDSSIKKWGYVMLEDAYRHRPEILNALKQEFINMHGDPFTTDKKSAAENIEAKINGWDKEAALNQDLYSTTYNAITADPMWSKITKSQQESVTDRLEAVMTAYYKPGIDSDGDKYRKQIEAGKKVGLDTTEYMLYQLALKMYDTDKNNSYKKDEVEAAIRSLTGLSNSERAYLWEMQGFSEKTNPWR